MLSGATSDILKSPSNVWFRRARTLTSMAAPVSATKIGMSTVFTSGIGTAMLPVEYVPVLGEVQVRRL